MIAAPGTELLRIEIDLRELRAASERLGRLAQHARVVSELSNHVRELVDADDEAQGSEVSVVPMPSTSLPAKMDPQIIDALSLILTPMGVAATAKLIVQIIEACRTRIPTNYELDFHGVGKITVSGPGVSRRQFREIAQLTTEAMKAHSREIRIRTKQDD